MISGLENYIYVKSSNSSETPELSSCEIMDLNGTVMTTVPLQKVSQKSDLYFGSFKPYSTNFYVQVILFQFIQHTIALFLQK